MLLFSISIRFMNNSTGKQTIHHWQKLKPKNFFFLFHWMYGQSKKIIIAALKKKLTSRNNKQKMMKRIATNKYYIDFVAMEAEWKRENKEELQNKKVKIICNNSYKVRKLRNLYNDNIQKITILNIRKVVILTLYPL